MTDRSDDKKLAASAVPNPEAADQAVYDENADDYGATRFQALVSRFWQAKVKADVRHRTEGDPAAAPSSNDEPLS